MSNGSPKERWHLCWAKKATAQLIIIEELDPKDDALDFEPRDNAEDDDDDNDGSDTDRDEPEIYMAIITQPEALVTELPSAPHS